MQEKKKHKNLQNRHVPTSLLLLADFQANQTQSINESKSMPSQQVKNQTNHTAAEAFSR
jgi:hypothetical protein